MAVFVEALQLHHRWLHLQRHLLQARLRWDPAGPARIRQHLLPHDEAVRGWSGAAAVMLHSLLQALHCEYRVHLRVAHHARRW